MIFTSNRIIIQSLPGGEKAFRTVSQLLFGPILAPPSEAIIGAPKFEIGTNRIVDSVQYNDLSEVRVEFNPKETIFLIKMIKMDIADPFVSFSLKKESFSKLV